jgi:methylenetetrahydrofolate dehydrogenase (NADP+)/methenyltetrahydrofolate cyclohydrolase
MAARVIDGKAIAQKILDEVAAGVKSLSPKPCLAIVLVGNNPASQSYVKKKGEMCEKVGIVSRNVFLPENAAQAEIEKQVEMLNSDPRVHAILVQLPLPPHVNEPDVLERVNAKKDVDGFSFVNSGKLFAGVPTIAPCTPRGIIHMLKESGVRIAGKHAVVIGRSNIVGKPLAMLLLQENATVTICHSCTKNLAEITRTADILVAAAGKPKLVKAEMVKEGAAVIDVGTTRGADGKLVGDVDFEGASMKASLISPVPGGVGPLTVAMLMKNTLECYENCTGSRRLTGIRRGSRAVMIGNREGARGKISSAAYAEDDEIGKKK